MSNKTKKTLSNSLTNFISRIAAQLEGTSSSTGRRSIRKTSKRCDYGTLEDRKMLATAAVIDGTLEVRGDNRSEVLSVRQVQDDLVVFSKIGDNAGQNIFRTSADNVDSIVMRGFGGNDQLVNRTNIQSQLVGGHGHDILVGGTGKDVVQGGLGHDRLVGDFGYDPVTISTTMMGGDDMLVGGEGNDVLMGIGGADTINGESGNDLLWGGTGADNLFGGLGDDGLIGNGGNDLLSGNDGNDRLRGEDGNDVLLGGDGNDLLLGADGNDRLRGNLGTDTVNAGNGDDILFSQGDARSSDILMGGHGDDTYRFAGEGEACLTEVLHDGNLAHDTIVETAFSGNDTVEYTGPGFQSDPRATFDNNTNLAFRYYLRVVETKFASTIENYSDLREELVSTPDELGSDSLPNEEGLNLDGGNSVDDVLNDVENHVPNAPHAPNENLLDLVDDATNPIDNVFEEDDLLEVDVELDVELDAELGAELDVELASDLDADLDAELDSELDSELDVDLVLT